MPNKTDHIIIDRDDVQAIARRSYEGNSIVFHFRTRPTEVASFAMELLRVHAGITAKENGQDDAGRQKLRREAPAEAVAYACETASLAFEEFEKRGWLIPMPSWQEIEENAKPEN